MGKDRFLDQLTFLVAGAHRIIERMTYPIRVCVVCSEEFELKPDKPGFANRCPACSETDEVGLSAKRSAAEDRQSSAEMNEARRQAMRNLLYRKDS